MSIFFGSLQHLTPEQEIQARKAGVENPTFVRDSFIEYSDALSGSKEPVIGEQ